MTRSENRRRSESCTSPICAPSTKTEYFGNKRNGSPQRYALNVGRGKCGLITTSALSTVQILELLPECPVGFRFEATRGARVDVLGR
jgi:hypothetical protein